MSLTALAKAPPYGSGRAVKGRSFCACSCGAFVVVRNAHLQNGHAQSCGCLQREHKFRHGHGSPSAHTPTYGSWSHMVSRCRSDTNDGWNGYGGRGITVCERWLVFENFLSDMGERPAGTSIDRKNNDGNYEPGNCRWATAKQQRQNQRG